MANIVMLDMAGIWFPWLLPCPALQYSSPDELLELDPAVLVAISPEMVRGRTIVSTTTNGTRALRACAGAQTVLAGSFLNLGATAEFIKRLQLVEVLLVCAGTGALHAGVRKSAPSADSMRKVRKLPSVAARAAFRNFTQKQGAGWRIRYSPGTALPEALVGGSTVKYPGTPEQAAAAFFADNGDLLNVDPLALRLVAKKTFMGITHLQYQQYKDGLPVEFSYARVHVMDNGSVVGYQGKFQPGIALNTSPALTEPAAIQAGSRDSPDATAALEGTG